LYSVIVAVSAALVAFAITAAVWSPVAGILPALLVFGLTTYLLVRRLNGVLDTEMKSIMEVMQAGRVEEGRARLEAIRKRWGRWVPYLSGQIDAQLGMIDYLQLKFDIAKPKLESGRARNWTAEVALGAIAWRQGRKDEAWKCFEAASVASSKEPMIYVVWATLRSRDGEREAAMAAIAKGLTALPGNPLLQQVQTTLANKRKLEPKTFPQTWYQFFPEELLQQMRMTGRRDGPAPNQVVPAPRPGPRQAPRR
jgi:hypothetical protein